MGFIDDPYLAMFVKKIYERHWKDDIKELLILVNGNNRKVVDFIKEYWNYDEKVSYIETWYEPFPVGKLYTTLYPHAKGDIIQIMDMDNFILRKNVLSEFGSQITSGGYDVIGSQSHAASRRIYELATSKWGHSRLNDSMLLIAKRILDQVEDVDFSRKRWNAGDHIKPLGWTVPTTFPPDYRQQYECADTIAYLSFQIWAITKKIRIIPISCPDYIHAGSLSSGVRNLLRTPDQKMTLSGIPPPTPMHNVPLERVAWWYHIYTSTYAECSIPGFNEKYKQAILQYAKRYNITEEILKNMTRATMSMYPTLL